MPVSREIRYWEYIHSRNKRLITRHKKKKEQINQYFRKKQEASELRCTQLSISQVSARRCLLNAGEKDGKAEEITGGKKVPPEVWLPPKHEWAAQRKMKHNYNRKEKNGRKQREKNKQVWYVCWSVISWDSETKDVSAPRYVDGRLGGVMPKRRALNEASFYNAGTPASYNQPRACVLKCVLRTWGSTTSQACRTRETPQTAEKYRWKQKKTRKSSHIELKAKARNQTILPIECF